MRSVEVSDKTRQGAIQRALEQLGVELHEAQVEILDEGSKGIFGLGARDVRVRVSAEHLADVPDPQAAALLREVITRMGMEATVTSEPADNGGLRLKVASPDSAILIGRKGQNLQAMQYLLNRMVHKGEGSEDSGERITIDIEGYLDRRQTSLEEMARRVAQKVKETGRRIRMKPLSAPERRVIHVTLQDNPDVRTFSVGDGPGRTVIVALKDEQRQEHRPEAPRPRGPRDSRPAPRSIGSAPSGGPLTRHTTRPVRSMRGALPRRPRRGPRPGGRPAGGNRAPGEGETA
ncbi:MAG: protein jag [Candidatus Hydrogenedentes bacterium]|nr:protein jag [Candidatus Hydrogenedentota bacterium]